MPWGPFILQVNVPRGRLILEVNRDRGPAALTVFFVVLLQLNSGMLL